MLETEINSANDNPLFDPEAGDVLHGGHFYGGHIASPWTALKTLVANLADLMDRQLALLVGRRASTTACPPTFRRRRATRAPINHGLKAVQIAASAWAAEALKLTMPASVFSRSTECHNQDKVSMGTIAARDALRVIELTEQIAAAHAIACVQAVRLRMRMHDLTQDMLGPTRLEIAWTVIPTVIVLFAAGYSWLVLDDIEAKADDALRVDVFSQQYAWTFDYPGFDNVYSRELHVPVDRQVSSKCTRWT